MNTTRRELLKTLALATLALPASKATWAQQRFNKNPFGLGVASGSATHDSVVLWTRLFDEGVFGSNLPKEPIPVKWEMAADAEFKQIVQAGVSNAVPALAHSVHAEVGKLPTGQRFYYRFSAGEYTSAVGRTRTFSAPGTPSDTLKIAYASCQNFELGYFNAYPHLVKESPDLVLFLGDYVYEYAPGKSGVRQHTPGWCLTLDDYRRRYAQYKQDKDLQQIHAACPWLVIWDDHEVQNDYAGKREGTVGPSADFQRRRAAAYQAFYEHQPLRASVLVDGLASLDKGGEVRIYDNYRFGTLMSISMLDGRQYRDPQACNPGDKPGSGHVSTKDCAALVDEGRSLLGMPQEQWLEKQLQTAKDQTWNFIAQPTLFGACVFNTGEGTKVWNDGWDGYAASRKRLTDQLIRHRVPNPVVLGGDVHENWVGYVKEDYNVPRSKAIGVEFCGTSVCSYDGSKDTSVRQRRNPHFIYSEGTRKGYAIAEVSAKDLKVHLRAVKDHKVKETDIETLASFRVAAGSVKIEQLS